MAKKTITHTVTAKVDDEDLDGLEHAIILHVQPTQRDENGKVTRERDLQVSFHFQPAQPRTDVFRKHVTQAEQVALESALKAYLKKAVALASAAK